MNSKIVNVVAVQFMPACAPMFSQAAALDRDKDPDQLWIIDIDRVLFQDCLKQRDSLRVRGANITPVIFDGYAKYERFS